MAAASLHANSAAFLSRNRSMNIASSTSSRNGGRASATSRRNAPQVAVPSSSSSSSSPTLAASLTSSTLTISASSSAALLPPAASQLSIFVTNLRLLDLDCLPDWPDISPKTFSTASSIGGNASSQGQLKRRVHCVEWALFRLFEIWDPDDVRAKLASHFPPTDQTSSLSLRAALLRSLEAVKKTGLLGRDAVVRKTMLDECKGERLEEVLAAFSSSVLKKATAEKHAGKPSQPLAITMALEDRGYAGGDRAELTVLALAYRFSLRKLLDEKAIAKKRFAEFARWLRTKEKDMGLGREALEKTSQKGSKTKLLDEKSTRHVWETVQNNWTGDERWLQALRYGDVPIGKGGILNEPFGRVWRRVEAGRLIEFEHETAASKGGPDLLRQLEDRVRIQKQRLEKWRAFRTSMFGETSVPPLEKESKRARTSGIDLGFGAHESLRATLTSLKKKADRGGAPATSTSLAGEYADLLQEMHDELLDVGGRQSGQEQLHALLARLQKPKRPEVTKGRRGEGEGGRGGGRAKPRRSLSMGGGTGEDMKETREANLMVNDEDDDGTRLAKRVAAVGGKARPKSLQLSGSDLMLDPLSETSPSPYRSSPNQKSSLRSPLNFSALRVYHGSNDTGVPGSPSLLGSPASLHSPNRSRAPSSPTRSAYSPHATNNKSLLSPKRSPQLSPQRSPGRSAARLNQQFPSLSPPLADELPVPSPTQHLASQILADMASHASPTPARRPTRAAPPPTSALSLADRTRLSMARITVRNSSARHVRFFSESCVDLEENEADLDFSMEEDLSTFDMPSPCPPARGGKVAQHSNATAQEVVDDIHVATLREPTPTAQIVTSTFSTAAASTAATSVATTVEGGSAAVTAVKADLSKIIPLSQEDLDEFADITITVPDTPTPAESLADRTRRSMAGYEAARKKAQLERRRSQRREARDRQRLDVPVPGRDGRLGAVDEGEEGPPLDEGPSILAESLIEAGVEDYETVFRSRPRLKTSPVISRAPSMEWGGGD